MFEGYEELNTQDVERMQEVIRTLLAQTFLPERKYDKKYGRMMPDRMYDFSDRHLEFLTEYFAVAGIKLCQDTELGIIYLEGADGIGEKLPKLATIYLLLLKLIYDEKMAAVSSSVNVITTFGELNGKAGEFRLIKGPSSMTEIKRAFAILKKYQMVEFLDVFDEKLENTKIHKVMEESIYGGCPVQTGDCNGHNKKLDAQEYHRSSELDIAQTDLILLLGMQQDIEDGDIYDTAKVEAFLVPAGTGVELYATTLHYAPCTAQEGGFRCVVVLPKGTNEELPFETAKEGENRLLAAMNKWLIAHEDAQIEGAFCGLKGENINI